MVKLWWMRVLGLCRQVGHLIGRWLHWSWGHKLLTAIGVATVAIIISLGWLTYTLLYPTVLVTPDLGPFESVKEYEAFVADNPLMTATKPADALFTIKPTIQSDKTVFYTIELSTPPIKPQMTTAYVENYLAALDHAEKLALNWIKEQGENPDEIQILWRPNLEEMRAKLRGEPYGEDHDRTKPVVTPSTTPTPSPSVRFPR